MRVLHSRDDSHLCGIAAANSEPDANRNSACHFREFVPLHRVSAHRPGRGIRGQEDEGEKAISETRLALGGIMATATRAKASPHQIGKPLKRKEDPRLIQGLAHYVDDVVLPGIQYAAILRSPYAHAKIRSIDISKAQAAPGVSLVITGGDTRGSVGIVPCAAQIPDMKSAPRPALAQDRVRFVGEGIAVVVATSRYAARDAVDLIEVDYEPLTPVVDPEKALEKGSPVLYDEHKDNVAYRW